MPKTEQEITETAIKLHDELSGRYYSGQGPGKEEFNRLHAQIWNDMAQELVECGYREPPMDWKAIYKSKNTVEAKFKVIAERLGLE